VQENLKKLKMLEKMELEVLERLKNTINQQDREIRRMEEVMNESKQGFYKREPLSPCKSPQKTKASTQNSSPTRQESNNVSFTRAVQPSNKSIKEENEVEEKVKNEPKPNKIEENSKKETDRKLNMKAEEKSISQADQSKNVDEQIDIENNE
jgi:hypothetical protein